MQYVLTGTEEAGRRLENLEITYANVNVRISMDINVRYPNKRNPEHIFCVK